MAVTNINGANQHTPDERQEKCWEFYLESIAAGKPNAMESAIKAGYERSSAENITLTGWFTDRLSGLRRKQMASKAERNLDRILDTDWERDGDVKPEVMRIVADVSKSTAKSLLKEHWSERTEHTGADGKDLQVNIISYADNTTAPLHTEGVPNTTT